ncbi:MAG: DNA primase, partial [Myxococcales bacterium]|nr:DNA primase [Myxococcales bacterium]
LCPFHQEKSPSFNVIPDKQIYHCFGCQAGGDVFRFLMTIEGLSFVEAVKELAAPVGLEVEERELTPAERKQLRARSTAFDVLEAAARQYEAWLWTGPAGAPAREYLERRELTAETIRAARLGYVPQGWSRLLDALHRDGFDASQVADVGLARPSDRGQGFYDFLRERVIIPIRDERGRVIAFGGRILEGDGPKYLNTPESQLYQKSHTLYGMDTARQAIQQKGRVVVVEGYFDVISLQQAGFGEAVATCGTALTADHLEKIRRLARDVVLVMDADEAGLRAAEKTLPMFIDAGISAWRVNLPGAKDPDELVRQEGSEAFERVLQEREPLFEWVVQRKLDAFGTSTMGRERALEEVVPLLAKVRDGTVTSRVARRAGIPEEIVLDRIRQHLRQARNPDGPPPEAAPAPGAPAWRPHVDATHLLWLLVHRYDEVADVLARVDPGLLDDHAPIRPVVARLLSGEPVAAMLPDLGEPVLQRTVQAVVARTKLYEPEEAVHAVLELLARMARPRIGARLASAKGDYERTVGRGEMEAALTTLQRTKALQHLEKDLDRAVRSDDVETLLGLLAQLTDPAPDTSGV